MNQSSTSVAYNLRTKGIRNTSGTIIKGCVKDATSKLSIGSIPSNYETIIYHSQSTKAFGTSQKRFYQQNKNQMQKIDIPNDSILSQQQSVKNPSHSTKGYGPFIAKQQRTWYQKRQAPGPGRYEFTKSADPSSKRMKKHRMNFIHEKKQNIVPIQKKQMPGPGQYYITEKKHANNGWKSLFKTKVDRSTYVQNQNNPGPGYYDVSLVKHAKSIIKEPLNRLQKLSPNTTFDIFENDKKSQVPGPGAYQYQIPTFKPLYERIKISGNFMINKKDRFNNQTDKVSNEEYTQEAPNVYSYNLKSQFDQEQRLIKWPCFMSQSKRMVFNDDKKLGPSFLSPKQENRKNFHFNIKGAWF